MPKAYVTNGDSVIHYLIFDGDESQLQGAAEEDTDLIFFFGEPKSIEEFIEERIIDLEKLSAWWKNSISDPNPWLDLTGSLRDILEWHKSWPVLVEGPPKYEKVRSFHPDIAAYQISQQMEWITRQEYIRRFGEEPPTAPLLRKIASRFCWHEDFEEEWRA